jgi:hypothetical protein
MKNLSLFILLILLGTNLEAYSKKIIFASFTRMSNAQDSLDSFKKSSKYKKIDKLSKENNFKVYVRTSGKYHIVVAEPFLKKSLAQEVYRLAKSNYKHAYISPYVAVLKKEKVIEKKEPPKVLVKKEKETPAPPPKNNLKKEQPKEQQPKEQAKEQPKEKILAQKEIALKAIKSMKKKVEYLDIESIVKYFFIFLVLSILFYYYRKFKRIYDEY